jgi:hypothetical protein
MQYPPYSLLMYQRILYPNGKLVIAGIYQESPAGGAGIPARRSNVFIPFAGKHYSAI